MKQSVRNALIAGVLVLSSFFFYLSFYDLPYNPFGGHDSAESDVASNDAPDKSLPDVPPEVPQDKNTGIDQEPGVSGDKIIVMAKTKAEDTDWVKDNLPDWQRAIYHMDDPEAPGLHPPINKGREAMAYLTYIVDFYTQLPSIMVFLHAHRNGYPTAWHTDAANHDNVDSVQNLRLDYVQRQGYANLRCIWSPGCPNEIQPFRQGADAEGRRAERAMETAWKFMFGSGDEIEEGNGKPYSNTTSLPLMVPGVLATPCCSQFAVSRDQVRKRPREEYIKFREWIVKTELDDDTSGRVLEYLWHVFFGRDHVYCPDMNACYCDVYGQCNRWR